MCLFRVKNLDSSRQALKAANLQLQRMENANKKLVASLGPHEPKHHKPWSEYSAQYQRQQKRKLASDISTALRFTTDTFFKPVRVDLVNKETKELLSISHNGSLQQVKEQPQPGNKETTVKQTLYVKERFNISDKAYHELSMIHSSLPCWYTINKEAKRLNSECDIFPTPGPVIGVQQSLKKRLTVRLEHLVQSYPTIKEESCIRIKITGDGTKVSKSMHILVIAFSVLDGNENPNSPGGNHVITLLNSAENYQHLSEAL